MNAFKNIYSQDFVKEYLANMRLAQSDNPEIAYQRVNESLQELIPKLKNFKSESSKFSALKAQLAILLGQIQQNNSEAIKLINEANMEILKGEALLSKPKEEIRLPKDEILDIQKDLDANAVLLDNTVLKQEKLSEELIKTSDEIDALFRMNP